MSSSSVEQCAPCAGSTHDAHHAIVGVNVVIGVFVVHCELLVVRVVPVVVCDDAVVRRTLSLIAFIVAIFHGILKYWRYCVYRKEGESRWLGVWRGWAESHTDVSSGKHMGWRRRENGEMGRGAASGGSQSPRVCRGPTQSPSWRPSAVPRAVAVQKHSGPAKFRVYGHGRPWGPGDSASPRGSFQLRGLEGDLACEPFSLREADKAGGPGHGPERRENDPNVELVERARTSVAKGWERRARSELRWWQSRVDPVQPRGRVVRRRLSV